MRLTADLASAKLPVMNTPAPWRYERCQDDPSNFDIRSSNDYFLALTIGALPGGDIEVAYNARLMAAAPALLEALRAAVPDHPLLEALA